MKYNVGDVVWIESEDVILNARMYSFHHKDRENYDKWYPYAGPAKIIMFSESDGGPWVNLPVVIDYWLRNQGPVHGPWPIEEEWIKYKIS